MSEQSWDSMGGYWDASLSEIEAHETELGQRMLALEYAHKQHAYETESWMFQIPMKRGEIDFLIRSLAHYDDNDCPDCADELDEFVRWVLSGFAQVLLAHGEYVEVEAEEEEEEPEE